MEVLRSYVVRLYREEPGAVVGVVEAVETGQVRPFRSADELWGALLASSSPRRTTSTNPDAEEEI